MSLCQISDAYASHLLRAFAFFQDVNEVDHVTAVHWPVSPEVDEEIWECTDRSYGDEDVLDEVDLLTVSQFSWDCEHNQ